MINDEYTDDRLNEERLQWFRITAPEPNARFTPVPKKRYPKYRDANYMP